MILERRRIELHCQKGVSRWHHLVRTVTMLSERGIGLRELTGQGAQIDTTSTAGRLSFGIFAALAEFESELIRERTMAGLQAARARGRKGGRKFALTKGQVRMAQAAMANRNTSVAELCKELGISAVTHYRYVDPKGNLRDAGKQLSLRSCTHRQSVPLTGGGVSTMRLALRTCHCSGLNPFVFNWPSPLSDFRRRY